MENLQYGSKGNRVSKLQNELKKYGFYIGKVDGIFGPKTRNAVSSFQSVLGMSPTGVADGGIIGELDSLAQDPSNAFIADPFVQQLISSDPRAARTIQNALREGGSKQQLLMAADQLNKKRVNDTGFGGNDDLFLTGSPDDPFWKSAMKDLEPEYKEGLELYKADFNAALQKSKQDFESYLAAKETQLAADKGALDTNEAHSGTLFSTGRVQRRSSLADAYNADIADKQRDLEYGLGQLGRGYEEQYGSKAVEDANFKVRGGSADGESLGFSRGNLRTAYKPIGSIYGKKNTDYQYNLRQRAQKKKYAPYLAN